MSRSLSIDPPPSAPEAVAVASAVAAVLEEEAAGAARDPIPSVYRSSWRTAGLKEGVVRMGDGGWRS